VNAEKEGEWSWKRELTGHFGNNSPGLRGMFLVLVFCVFGDLVLTVRTL
jgi:hypothetical protein